MAVRANPNLTQRTLIMAGMAVVIIAGMVIGQVWQTYNVTVANARHDIKQLTQVLEAGTNATFRTVELIIDHAVEKILDENSEANQRLSLAERFIAIAADSSFIHSVAYVATDGLIRDAVIRGADTKLHVLKDVIDISAQPPFIIHRDNAAPSDAAFYVTRAGQDTVSREWVITISKAVYDDQGAFQGVCLVTISLDEYTAALTAVLPGQYTAIELYRRDGALLASTSRKTPYNGTFVFKDMIPISPEGVYRVTSPEEKVDQLVAYQVLERFPVVITASAQWRMMLSQWWNSSIVLAMSALTGIFVIIALTLWLVRRISVEHTIQRALVNSERSLVESQRLGGITHFERDLRTGQVVWPANMFEWHGVDPDAFDLNRDNYLDLVVPEDRAKVIEAWGPREAPLPSGVLECRVARSDGEIRHMRYSWKALDDDNGSPSRIFGVVQDVTAIRNAENIIRDDEERLRDIVECSSDYIWEVNAEGIITLFTGAGVEQLGLEIGVSRSVLTHYAFNGGDIPLLHQAFQDRVKFRNLLAPVRNAAGETRWVRVSGNPRFDVKGRFLGYRGAGADVTELRRQQERDEDQRKAEALGRLASGLAHEINNLLQPILIYANFGSSQSDLAGNVRQYFSRIGRAAEGATQIVRNVLAFARQRPPSRENVNVLDVVRETVDLIGGTLASGTTVAVAEDVHDLVVRVDRTGLAQVLTNLLTNAIEVLPLGGVIGVNVTAIELSREASKTLGLVPGSYCRLAVEDNGPGIAADDIGKVFDPFFTTKPQGKGTGLGLSVVFGLAKSWGGTAAVESTVGTRTCFMVYLPLAERYLQAAQ
jgi:PAS domain S-box-containing protein